MPLYQPTSLPVARRHREPLTLSMQSDISDILIFQMNQSEEAFPSFNECMVNFRGTSIASLKAKFNRISKDTNSCRANLNLINRQPHLP